MEANEMPDEHPSRIDTAKHSNRPEISNIHTATSKAADSDTNSVESSEQRETTDIRAPLHIDIAAIANEENTSDTSSVVPTSARLSIATTTHPAANVHSYGNDSIGTMLDTILGNPGWTAGASDVGHRRNSLYSMRSLQPTLPPYEEYRNHALAVPTSSAGPSNLQSESNSNDRDRDLKQRTASEGPRAEENALHGTETPSLNVDNDPENSITAHYSRIVRTIDSRYTSEIEQLKTELENLKVEHERKMETVQAEHDRRIAHLRNEMDATYRVALKSRDKAAEKAREQAAFESEACEERIAQMQRQAAERESQLNDKHARMLEKARHEVEDVWERRWRDKFGLVDEEDNRRIKGRDGEWLTFLQRECPDIVEIARVQMISSLSWQSGES